MTDGPQRQRHGVTKNLVEGLGGLLVGAAAVLLLRAWLRPGDSRASSTLIAATPAAGPEAPRSTPIATEAKRRPRTKKEWESHP